MAKRLLAILEGMPAGVPLVARDIDRHLARRWLGFGRGGRSQAGARCGAHLLGCPVSAERLRDRSAFGWTMLRMSGIAQDGLALWLSVDRERV